MPPGLLPPILLRLLVAGTVVHPKATGANAKEKQTSRLVEQFLTGKKTMLPVTSTGISAHSYVDSDEDCYREPCSHPGALEEEGELSDQDCIK